MGAHGRRVWIVHGCKEDSRPVADFSLPASTGQTLSLDSFKGKVPLVVLFLDLEEQADNALLTDLNSRHRDFGSERSQVLAVLRVTAREARRTAEEMDLSIPLLADASGAMARDYGIDDQDEKRVAVIADRDGGLVRRFDPLSRDDDPSEVIDGLVHEVRAIRSNDRRSGD